MKLALLGSNGQLGQDILARADRRFEIVPVTRAQLDVTDGEALARLLPSLDADVVVNATSYHRTDEAEDQAGLAVAVNAHAVQRMAEVCARSGIRFVHVSTDYVFSGIDRRQPYTETDAPGPLNVYGASKLMGESLAAISAPDALVLRVASLFGVAGSSGKGGNFVETMLRLARERGEVRVVDDIVMSPTSTADLAGWLLDMVAADGASRTLELRMNTANGGSVWLKGRAMRAGADKGSGTVRCFLTDITEFKLAQARLAAATTRDPVTGFINRTALKELLGQKIAEAGRRGESVAALILTIDRFRLLRDSLGSEMSDQVLIGLGGRVRSALGEADILCRHGDDEFAIVLDDARGDESIACVATRLLRGIADPIEIGAEEFRLTCSIGIALCPPNGRDADMLLRSAAAAAYVARHGGGNAFRFFAPDMNDRAEQRFGLERDLRRAIERGEFELNYQPQMDAEGTALVGAEALLRWKHPQRGEIEPSRFIPLAEEVGLITDIGEWVASEVTRQMALWWRDGLAVPRVAINVSCAQFRNGFVDHLALCLEEHGVRPDRIEVEITESLMMEDLPEVSRAMTRLRAMGVRIAIDDFGTGYSSLAVLQRLAPDALKIDRQFADSVDTHPAGGAIVKAIVGMADALGLEVVAEGVETQAQFRSLAQLGCTLFQGRLWSMPASAAQFGARFLGSSPMEVPVRA